MHFQVFIQGSNINKNLTFKVLTMFHITWPKNNFFSPASGLQPFRLRNSTKM